ncbi:MAG: hypothetical protein A4E42_00328 [Methanoregulaceae archaeon PtaU1.Bin222]|nr:MAG: hypothetical protein A4E42_00328 [Methanoregulaceae archaeon PtaU1.Bin222]
MIPILQPEQYPAILANGLLIILMVGIPTALLSLCIFFLLERVQHRWVRLVLPAAGAMLILSISLFLFSGIPPSPEEYQRTWIPMMLTSFLLNALVILAPFPFIRPHIRRYSPYLVIPITLGVTFFLLVAFGLMGGDAQVPPDTEFGMMIGKVTFVITEFVLATLVYGCIGLLGRIISVGTRSKG